MVLFVSGLVGSEDIFRANIRLGQGEISETVQLTTSTAWRETFPQCSPDGTQIAFSFSRDGFNFTINIMDTFGHNRSDLNGIGIADSRWPSWAPDGKGIVFSARNSSDEDYELFIIENLENPQPIQLTDNDVDDSHPAWSPNGRFIAFDKGRTTDTDIMLMDLLSEETTNLTQANTDTNSRPAWDPTGRRIAFESNRTKKPEIFIMNDDGTGLGPLTNTVGNSRSPAWSPDGAYVIFESNEGGKTELLIVPADQSSKPRLLASLSVDAKFPSWCSGLPVEQ